MVTRMLLFGLLASTGGAVIAVIAEGKWPRVTWLLPQAQRLCALLPDVLNERYDQ